MRWSPQLGFIAPALLAACASTAPEQKKPALAERATGDESSRPGTRPVRTGEPDDGIVLEYEKGVLDQRLVDRVMDRRARALVACYPQAGAAQKYAAGQVSLRFFVTSSGEVSNVLVTASELGNYAVERCLVAEGRRITFPAPRGERATDFEYSLHFRSGREMTVVEWDTEVIARDVASQVGQLAPCGAIGPAPVRAVLYIEPGGGVGSVGLASDSPIDTEASSCAVQHIRRWRLPDDRSHVVRSSFTFNPGSTTVAANVARPPARLVKRVATRRPAR
jgi:hypothetical protein